MAGIGSDLQVEWVKTGGRAQVRANPEYPGGIDVDVSNGASFTCGAPLPYPAPSIGRWMVTCKACDMRVVVTAAGRPDDPRSIRIACKKTGAHE